MDLYTKLLEVCRLFRIDYEYLGYETIQMGNVNKTYKVNFMLPEGTPKSFLVQNVNTYAFRNPIGLMNNIDKVTEHIRAKKPGQLALHFHHTADRKTYVVDGDNFWRMTNYVHCVTFNAASDYDILWNTGCAFGEFQADLNDFDIHELIETIPGFHNSVSRMEQFRAAVESDKMGRAAEMKEEIEFALSKAPLCSYIVDGLRDGRFRTCVTHNDTKINNVLMDKHTGEGVCIIDLDIVMPGSVLYDFGDAIRFGASTALEDETDLSKVSLDLEMFDVFVNGFVGELYDSMTKDEIMGLPMGAYLMTLETGIRFLGDYLNGDVYYHTAYPGHNRDRARNQLALLRDMDGKMEEMQAIVAKYL